MKTQEDLLEIGRRSEEVLRDSIFEDLFSIKDEDFIDSPIPLESGDVIIGVLPLVGKMMYTRHASFLNEMRRVCPPFMETDDLSNLVGSFYCGQIQICNAIKEKVIASYTEQALPFPEDRWQLTMSYALRCAAMVKIINGLISSKISINSEFVIKQGFTIVAVLDDAEDMLVADFFEN